MYRNHRYRKSKTGRTWEPEYLRFPGSRDRVIIHRLRNSKAPIACGDGQRTADRNNSGLQEKIQKYNRPEMDTTTHNTFNIKRLGEPHT